MDDLTSHQQKKLLQQAYTHSVAMQRRLIVWLGLAGLVLLITAAVLSSFTRSFNALDRYILVAGALVYGACAVIAATIDNKHLYAVVRAWILCAMAVVIALTANALFGASNSNMLSAYSPPFFMSMPAVIVLCHSYLTRRQANLFSSVFSGILSIMMLAFIMLYHEQISDVANLMLLSVCVIILLPATIGMMNLQQSNQELASAQLQALIKESEHQQRLQQRAEQTDRDTQLLNLAGLREMMTEQLNSQPDAFFQTLSIGPNSEQLDDLKPDQIELLINRIALTLRDSLQDQALLARTSEWRFFALAKQSGPPWSLSALNALQVKLEQIENPQGRKLQWHIGSAIADNQSDLSFALEEADFQRYLAESREQAMVISPVLQSELNRLVQIEKRAG